MVFNVVSRNCDDHSKNIAFLMGQNGKWSLSPAYDVCYAYDPAGKFNFQHFLSVNGKFNDIAYKDISEVGAKIGLKNRSIIVEQVIDTVLRWSEYAQNTGVDKTITKGIGSVHQTQIGARNGVLIRKRGFEKTEIHKSAIRCNTGG